MRKHLAWVFVFVLGGFMACGGDDDSGNGGTTTGDTTNGSEVVAPPPSETVVPVSCDGVSPNQVVVIADNSFSPREVKVPVGGIVQWTNTGNQAHTVTSGEPGHSDMGVMFDSGSLAPGESFCYQFTRSLNTHYFCRLHPEMEGEVEVGDDQDRDRDRDRDDDDDMDDDRRR